MPNPPYNGKPCPISRRQLAQLNWDERLTVDALALRFGVSPMTIYRWFKKYGLDRGVRKVEWDKIQDATMDAQGEVIWVAVPEVSGGSEQQWLMAVDHLSDSASVIDENDPFSKLSSTQRRAIPLMAGLMKQEIDVTNAEVCEKLGISEPTLIAWRKEPVFRDALIQFRKAELNAEGTMVWTEKMMTRFYNDRDTADDRKLMADVLGLTNKDQTVNVNIGFRPPQSNLKDVL